MKRQILLGVESFSKIVINNYFYVDKTLFVKELLENRGEVTLVTRPRRFGKTMNMSMLRHFFDVTEDNSALFHGLKIAEHPDLLDKHLNKYPIICLTMKDLAGATYDEAIEDTRGLIASIYEDNRYLYESDCLSTTQKEVYASLLSEKSTVNKLKNSLKFLTKCLYLYHQKRVVVLFDEYDTPIDNSVANGFFKEMVSFMRGFMGNVFKSNDYLEFGVLTGVLRVSKESLVSSFNNPKICGITDDEFSTCFGFTDDEVRSTCVEYGYGDLFTEVQDWYDGYRFGSQRMYNPWSITQFLDRKGKFDNYWVNTGSVRVVQDAFYQGDAILKNDLAALLTGTPITMTLEDGITYPLKYTSSNTFWSLLLNAGYLKPCNGASKTSIFKAELVNQEISNIFSYYAQKWFNEQMPKISKKVVEFFDCLCKGDAQGVQTALNESLLNEPSYFDFKGENSYHMFIYGMLLAVSDKKYVVYSNPESGKGRLDCLLKPMDKDQPAIIVEFKHAREFSNLAQEAETALEQIDDKAYIHTLKKEGFKILKYGIALHKKTCEVKMAQACQGI